MEYKARDFKIKFGIETRRVQYLVEHGLVGYKSNPGRSPAGRTFSDDNALELLLADKLFEVLGQLSTVKVVFEKIKEDYPETFKCSTHEQSKGGYFVYAYDIGTEAEKIYVRRLHSKNNIRVEILKLNLSKHISASVVNISGLYDKLVES